MQARIINDENAESIGRPFLVKALDLVTQSNQTKFHECFPGLRLYNGLEKFDDAADHLRLLGNAPTVEYLDQLIKPDWNVLLWRLESQYSDNALMVRQELTETKDELKLSHLSFKQLIADEKTNSVSKNVSEHVDDIGCGITRNSTLRRNSHCLTNF